LGAQHRPFVVISGCGWAGVLLLLVSLFSIFFFGFTQITRRQAHERQIDKREVAVLDID
jgi:hypothetical protein